MKEVKFKSFSAKATALKRAILCSAGYNLFSAKKVTIGALRTGILFTDISMKFDGKLVGKICSRSSLSARSTEAGAGVVDSDYRGIIYVLLPNLSCEEGTFNTGNKIAPVVFEKISLPVLSKVLNLLTRVNVELELLIQQININL